MSLARSLKHWGWGSKSRAAFLQKHHNIILQKPAIFQALSTRTPARHTKASWSRGTCPLSSCSSSGSPFIGSSAPAHPPKQSPQSRARSPVAKTPKPQSTSYFHSIEAQPPRANSYLTVSNGRPVLSHMS